MTSVAIFGGTFNPIHYGHLALAEEVRTRFKLEKVIFVPTFLPPHKEPADLAEAKLRTIMIHLATVSNPLFEVSTYEIDKGGKSYSIDTVKYFQQKLGKQVQLHFILGADMLVEIDRWKNIEELFRICRFIAVPRPGFDIQKIMNQYFLSSENFKFASELLENITVADVPMYDISATDIRRRVKEWKSIKYLVPEPVENFIHNQKIYL